MQNGNGNLPVFLRAPRSAALWLIGVLLTVATVVAFVLSYHGLFDWALHHQWPTPLAAWFPFLVDLLIVVAEGILFVAAIDGKTPWRVRALAWAVLLAFTGLSTVLNATHAAHASPMTRAGFALPPLVLAIALGFGLGELKRQAAKYRNAPAAASVPASAGRRLPSLREIQERRACGQRAAEVARAEVQLDRRGRGGVPPVPAAERTRGGGVVRHPAAPGAQDRSRGALSAPPLPPAAAPAGAAAPHSAPAPAGALSPNGRA